MDRNDTGRRETDRQTKNRQDMNIRKAAIAILCIIALMFGMMVFVALT